jgi:hypothetical protein
MRSGVAMPPFRPHLNQSTNARRAPGSGKKKRFFRQVRQRNQAVAEWLPRYAAEYMGRSEK